MKIDRIAYEQLYPTGVYANQRFRAEASVDWEKDDIMECYKTLQSAVEKAFVALNPQIKWQEVPESPIQEVTFQKPDSKESAIDRMITAINTCIDIKVLETFGLLVRNNVVLQETYNRKFKELQL